MQTTISSALAGLEPGMRADSTTPLECLPGVNAEASSEIPFGVAVKWYAESSGVTSVKLLSTDADLVWGIVAHGQAYAPATSAAPELGTTGILPEGRVSIARRGRIAVRVEEAVAPGDRAFVRFATGAVETGRGTFRKSQEVIAGPANSCIDITKWAVFETTADAQGIAVLSFDFTIKP